MPLCLTNRVIKLEMNVKMIKKLCNNKKLFIKINNIKYFF